MAANKPIINSGNDVPKATTVNPITKLETPNFLAKDEELSTIQLALFTKRQIPIIKRI